MEHMTIEFIKSIFDIIVSIAVTMASFVAIYNVNQWRKENVWKRKFEIGEQTLINFYEARDCINNIRNPFYSVGEGETRKKSQDETKSETELLNSAYVVIERFEKNKEIFTNIKKLEYKFKAVFGAEKAKPFNDINKLMVDIIYASQILGRNHWQRQGRVEMSEEEFQQHLTEMHNFENKIWVVSEKDEVNLQLKEIIQTIENTCTELIYKNKI